MSGLIGRIMEMLSATGGSDLRRRFTAGTLGAYAMVVVGNVLNLAITMVLTRWWFGKPGFGVYAFALSGLNLMCIVAGLGMERLLVREVARCAVHEAWGLMHGLLRWANGVVGVASLVLAVAGAVVAFVLMYMGKADPQTAWTFIVAMIGLPFFAISILRQSTMRGLHHVLLGIMPELLLMPVLLLGLLVAFRWFCPTQATPCMAMVINVAVYFVVLVAGMALLRRVMPAQVLTTEPEYQRRSWLASTLPFTLVSGMFVLNTRPSAILLGPLMGKQAVAGYSAALRGAEVVLLIVVSMNTVLLPTVAQLFASHDMVRLQKVVTVATRAVCAVSAVAVVGLVVCGRWFLLLFGREFQGDWATLAILCVGQFLGSTAAFSANLLTMTGHERDAARGIALSTLLNVAGNLALIPLWGVNGAAVATSASLVAGNLYMARVMRARTGIRATVVG